MPARKTLIRLAASICATLVLVWLIGQYVDVEKLLSVISMADPLYLLIAAALYLIHQILRVIRLNVYPDIQLPVGRTVLTMLVQSPINATLPVGLGDAALVAMLKKFHGLDWRIGTGSLISTRLADLGVFVVFFLCAIATIPQIVPDKIYPFMLGLSALLLCAVLALGGIALWVKKSKNVKLSFFTHLQAIINHLHTAHKTRVLLPIFGLTLLMWILMYGFNVAIVMAVGFEIPLLLLLWIYIIPTDLLPVKGIANLGTYEAAWFAILIAFGFSAQDAALIAFGTHAVIFLLRIAGGIVGVAGMAFTNSTRTTAPMERKQ